MSLACTEARLLAALAHDQALAPDDAAALAQHLAGCAGCRAHAAELARLSAGLRALAMPPPPGLARRIAGALEAAAPATRPWRWPAAVAAALVAGLALGLKLGLAVAPTPGASDWRAAASEAHLRALLPADAAMVASADPHVLRPWFAGRLDFAPPVRDLAEAGFPLLGARLDYVEGRKVAVVQYGRRAHRIALLAWPEPGADRAPQAASHAGHAMLRWREGGFARVLVGDLNAAELRELAVLLGAHVP